MIVNKSYQRSSGIWLPGPSAYFIDTILEGYPFPKIYIYEFLDKGRRKICKEVVDGQQRIGAIQRFYNNEISIRTRGENYGKRYRDLDDEAQEAFISYSVSVDVIRNAKKAEILEIFRRMNAYTLPLNEAEKRHSSHNGPFKWFVNEIADRLDEFFIEFGVFSEREILRMADAAFIADCILAMENGVINTSPKGLNDLYQKYDEHFEHSKSYQQQVLETFKFITENFGDLRKTFIMKPYALHSLFTSLVHCQFGIETITDEWNVQPINKFATEPQEACKKLFEMSQAHEAQEIEGKHSTYVWGCLSTTHRRPRRTARVASILQALGANVPEVVDANLS